MQLQEKCGGFGTASNAMFARGRESIQGRRAFGQSGVHPLASLLHQTVDGYTVRPRKIAQVPLVADLLDEPSTSSCVDMLAALPEEDSLFYASEDAVVSWEGKCTQTFTEIEERFGFLGGAPEEWVRYLTRQDLPAGLWTFFRGTQ